MEDVEHRRSEPTGAKHLDERRLVDEAAHRGDSNQPAPPAVFLPHAGEAREAPEPGEIFRQSDLAATLRELGSRLSEEHRAEHLDETCGGKRCRERQHAAPRSEHEWDGLLGRASGP